MILAHIIARIDVPRAIINAMIVLGALLYYAALIAAIVVFLVIYDANRKPARAQINPNCSEFVGLQIAVTCCCTNDCCREAEPGEFQNMASDTYRSIVTGQVVRRTGWSPDGRTIKCACDLGNDGRWFKHPRANVRCLFVPMPAM